MESQADTHTSTDRRYQKNTVNDNEALFNNIRDFPAFIQDIIYEADVYREFLRHPCTDYVNHVLRGLDDLIGTDVRFALTPRNFTMILEEHNVTPYELVAAALAYKDELSAEAISSFYSNSSISFDPTENNLELYKRAINGNKNLTLRQLLGKKYAPCLMSHRRVLLSDTVRCGYTNIYKQLLPFIDILEEDMKYACSCCSDDILKHMIKNSTFRLDFDDNFLVQNITSNVLLGALVELTGKKDSYVDFMMNCNLPLINCIRNGTYDAVKILLDSGKVDPFAFGPIPYKIACLKGHVNIIHLLASHRSFDRKAKYVVETIHEVCARGYSEEQLTVVLFYSNHNCCDDCLCAAYRTRNFYTAPIIAKNIDVLGESAYSVLQHSVQYGSERFVRLFTVTMCRLLDTNRINKILQDSPPTTDPTIKEALTECYNTRKRGRDCRVLKEDLCVSRSQDFISSTPKHTPKKYKSLRTITP